VRYSATKVPLQSSNGRNAASTKPFTWGSHKAAEKSPHGIGTGFVLNGDGVACIDLDGCLEGSKLAPWASEILAKAPKTFVEVSPSGKGLHIWGFAKVETGKVIRDGRKVEIYGNGRYICVTGKRFRGSSGQLADISELVSSITA
jgi:primase-polymerase (primpol)-like protein